VRKANRPARRRHSKGSRGPNVLVNKLKSREQTPEEAVAEMMVEGITTNALTARSYSEDNPKCQNVPGTECQIQKLVNGLDAAVNAGTSILRRELPALFPTRVVTRARALRPD
jgi:hypothetical protein